jgi:hypothetical protein
MKLQIRNRSLAALGVAVVSVTAAAGGCLAIDKAAEKAYFPKLEKTREAFLASIGKTSITVFPAAVRRSTITYDDGASAKLTEFLNTDGLAKATTSDRHVPITGPWRHNQARMLRESAKEFAAYVRANPIGTRYALLPEYLGGKTEAVGIHAYIVDSDGTVAFQILLNSHWEEFSRVKPKTADECTAVLIDVLRDRLKIHATQKP